MQTFMIRLPCCPSDPLLPAQEGDRTADILGILDLIKGPFKVPVIPPPNELQFPDTLNELQEFLGEYHPVDGGLREVMHRAIIHDLQGKRLFHELLIIVTLGS